ncbi:hypothetical protein WI29_20090 [Burkholderia ubonensis]|uniref:Uncharacterized protein n=1 Tax=Burkholderia ubonensis TaxID=101571 RepID=A0A102KDF6_9BURK|nr:hypothetical protein WI31_08340 [Burkholderia ubonensis]KUZ15438.1 hypothetical protein WI29_20090 [Burkholderia ubonensis]KUZ32014.1 hypothetical protein WI32_21840 [Burkholderia ubonensis]KUZ52124.1 hypothetical protein WI34_28885 [Burkholderia ubonensis]KUZ55632.1 hypothetical protein WI33_06370 [Burkholderia ubonensis]
MLIASQPVHLLIRPRCVPHRKIKVLRQRRFTLGERLIYRSHQLCTLRMSFRTDTQPSNKWLRVIELTNTSTIEMSQSNGMPWVFDLWCSNGVDARRIQIPVACKPLSRDVGRIRVMGNRRARCVWMGICLLRRQTLLLRDSVGSLVVPFDAALAAKCTFKVHRNRVCWLRGR